VEGRVEGGETEEAEEGVEEVESVC